MKFSIKKSLALLGVATTVEATVCTGDLTTEINQVTALSQSTIGLVTGISIFNAPINGPEIVANFAQIGNLAAQAVNTIATSSPTDVCPADVQQAICAAFTGFVTVHQTLIADIIARAAQLSGFTTPIGAALATIEKAVDTIVLGFINFVPLCASTITTSAASLDGSLGGAVRQLDPGAAIPLTTITFSGTTTTTGVGGGGTTAPVGGGGTTVTVTVPVPTTITAPGSTCPTATPVAETCSQVAINPKPAAYICGTPGTFATPRPQNTTTELNADACAATCALNKRWNGGITCYAFTFNPTTRTCVSHYFAPVFMGYAANASSPNLVYNIQCYQTSCT